MQKMERMGRRGAIIAWLKNMECGLLFASNAFWWRNPFVNMAITMSQKQNKRPSLLYLTSNPAYISSHESIRSCPISFSTVPMSCYLCPIVDAGLVTKTMWENVRILGTRLFLRILSLKSVFIFPIVEWLVYTSHADAGSRVGSVNRVIHILTFLQSSTSYSCIYVRGMWAVEDRKQLALGEYEFEP